MPLLSVLMLSCHDNHEFADDPYGNFDALWRVIDEKYCFFPENGVDWAVVGKEYRSRIFPGITDRELFQICSEMLFTLRDGHVNLIAPFNTSYYRKWWSDYPQDFSLRTLQEYYLDFDWQTAGSLVYKILPPNIGYLRYASFSLPVGEGNLDHALYYLSACDGLILDIRDNGGGELSNIEPLLSRFIHERGTFAYIRHKKGPAHDDFSEPYPLRYSPSGKNRIVWDKPVALLINRSCYSAANTFAAIMKGLSQVTLVGARTGGGAGLPFQAELPNGWKVRFSASPISDKEGNVIEKGIGPSEGFEVSSNAVELAEGRDAILETAMELFR